MLSDPLDLPATTERLGSLASKNVLPEAALERALELASPPPSAEAWRVYLSRTFLGLGAALCGAGVVTFIAFNWAALGRFAKLGLVGALIVACATAGFRTVPKLRGRIALAAAAILVGPLFAIYGQAYQTGADPFELFVAWAALTLLWTVAADLSGLWLFCLALIEVALALYWEQVLQPAGDREELALFLVLAAVNLTALAIWEIRMRRTAAAESGRWMPRTLAGFAVASLVVPAVAEVADLHHVEHGGATRVLAFVAFVATTAFLGLVLTGTGAGLRRVSHLIRAQFRSSRSKDRVERVHQTLQDRLVKANLMAMWQELRERPSGGWISWRRRTPWDFTRPRRWRGSWANRSICLARRN